jgi:hypothetical protein
MRRREARLGRLERAVEDAVRAELQAFLARLEAELDGPTYERLLEITAAVHCRPPAHPRLPTT